MTLLAGNALDPKKFFKSGTPQVHGSSFDLTIGCIFDHQGKKVEGPFTIKPGHMVQVVSSEILNLSDRFTGHVTYKTTMTRQGIWALTVGIVDPGWQGPIATTLLNFSRIDHSVAEGDAFLRVSLFEHDPISPEMMRKAPSLDVYLKDIQKIAASSFPTTFLNTTEIANGAAKKVIRRIRIEALPWVAGIAIVLTLSQVFASWYTGAGRPTMSEVEALRDKMEVLQTKLLKLEPPSLTASPPALPAPSAPTSAANETALSKTSQPALPATPASSVPAQSRIIPPGPPSLPTNSKRQ